MANDQRVLTGCRPIMQPYGNIRVNAYQVTTGAIIYLNTPLTLDANGRVAVMTSAANVVFLGVAVGFLDKNKASLPSDITTLSAAPYFPAAGEGNSYVLVTDDPNQLYIMEEGTGGTDFTQLDIGQTVTFEEVSKGSTTTGLSSIVIEQSILASSTQGTFQLVAIADRVNSDGTPNTAGDGCKWIVRPTRHQLGNMAVSVPV